MPSERAVLRDWVAGKAKGLPPEGLTGDLPLLAGRHLTSLHIPELILLLERLRGRVIDVERLEAGDFRDLDTIAARFLSAESESGSAEAGSAAAGSAAAEPRATADNGAAR